MSWKDKLQNIDFEIKTGDGKTFKPLWKSGEKSKDFNVSKYNFINVEGSFVDRKKPEGNNYPLIFFFQGDDNIEQSDDFELSANDNGVWTITHPFYGTIKGHPTNLRRNDASYNITEITVDFWESIGDDYPLSTISESDEVQSRVDDLNNESIKSITADQLQTTTDIIPLGDSINNSSARQFPDLDSFNDYYNTVQTAITSSNTLVTELEAAMFDAQQVMKIPANFNDTIDRILKGYVDSFNSIKEYLDTVFQKAFFEIQGATIIAGMCQCSINPDENEYITRADVEKASQTITGVYFDYLSTLDASQVNIYDIQNNWAPNSLIQAQLLSLVNLTVNRLYRISFNARQERSLILEADSNLLVLTHRFIGLDIDDKNIDIFRKINNIKNKKNFVIRKGTLIKYFV